VSGDIDMILMLDSMAQRYSCLPSDILAKGDTLDLTIMTTAIHWHNERQKRQEQGLAMPSNHGYSTEALQDMLKRARE
jgi:hypothetical protein